MRKLLTILLFPVFCFGQNADWKEPQAKVDIAVMTNGIVNIDRNYTYDLPIVAAKWDSVNNKYQPFTIQIVGRSTFWDVGNISQLTYTGKDGFALGIHLGKGCVIKGINIRGTYKSPNITQAAFFQSSFKSYGDTTCRDSRYSPHAGIVIDPFRDVPPPDGGYPGLQKYYRGKGGNGGSTGFYMRDLTFDNLTMGLVFSPNGQTANCENMTVEYVRIYNTKAGFVGCQAQEKSNSLYAVFCWGRTHTLFQWGGYGNGTPGSYTINRVQIAGGVVKLLNRVSGGYFPLTINDVFAESLGSIGQWQSSVGDKLSNSIIGFAPPDIAGSFPASGHVYGQGWAGGITFDNCVIRYYGKPYLPILFNGEYNTSNCTIDRPIWGYKGRGQTKPGFAIDLISGDSGIYKLKNKLTPGSSIVYMNYQSWIFEGLGFVSSDSTTIIYLSPNVMTNIPHGMGVYRKL